MVRNVVFIGAGKLATNLAVAMRQKGFAIRMVYSRTPQSAKALADRVKVPYTTHIEQLPIDADVYVYALCDEVLKDIVSKVAVNADALHVHTAGSMTLDVFGADKKHCGVLYPFQTFSKDKLVDFSQIPILIESQSDVETVEGLAKSLSKKVYYCDSKARGRLHIAGVLANNFTMCMYALAAEQLERVNLPFEVLLPLIDETAAKVHILSPKDAFTGPAIRGDKAVQNEHIKLIGDSALQDIYRLVSNEIQRLGKTGKAD